MDRSREGGEERSSHYEVDGFEVNKEFPIDSEQGLDGTLEEVEAQDLRRVGRRRWVCSLFRHADWWGPRAQIQFVLASVGRYVCGRTASPSSTLFFSRHHQTCDFIKRRL